LDPGAGTPPEGDRRLQGLDAWSLTRPLDAWPIGPSGTPFPRRIPRVNRALSRRRLTPPEAEQNPADDPIRLHRSVDPAERACRVARARAVRHDLRQQQPAATPAR